MEKKVRNPDWSREELLLALELYFASGEALPNASSVEVKKLSETLTKFGHQTGQLMGDKFRNANGVSMKLNNFRRWDPAYTTSGKIGLPHGNKLEEAIWNEFSSDKAALRSAADEIRSKLK